MLPIEQRDQGAGGVQSQSTQLSECSESRVGRRPRDIARWGNGEVRDLIEDRGEIITTKFFGTVSIRDVESANATASQCQASQTRHCRRLRRALYLKTSRSRLLSVIFLFRFEAIGYEA